MGVGPGTRSARTIRNGKASRQSRLPVSRLSLHDSRWRLAAGAFSFHKPDRAYDVGPNAVAFQHSAHLLAPFADRRPAARSPLSVTWLSSFVPRPMIPRGGRAKKNG